MKKVLIVGGGHNGLVASILLSQAGFKVEVVEKHSSDWGGAAVSKRVFPDYDARLSEYAYLVALFPKELRTQLGLKTKLLPRDISSFTPVTGKKGLLVYNNNESANVEQFFNFTKGYYAYNKWKSFYGQVEELSRVLWPTFLERLPSKADIEYKIKQQISDPKFAINLLNEPIEEVLNSYFEDDVLKGVVFTDAKIGVHSYGADPSLQQNICFLYHLVGNISGHWHVPKGGMGNLTTELKTLAQQAGASFYSCIKCSKLSANGRGYEALLVNQETGSEKVDYYDYILWNGSRLSLFEALGTTLGLEKSVHQGTACKVNMLLERLPALKNGEDAREAFKGTFHINESYNQLEEAFRSSNSKKLPEKLPAEIYCHTLTDSSILSLELQEKGYQTLTLFGLDISYSLVEALIAQEMQALNINHQAAHLKVKETLLNKYLEGINEFLAEPLENVLAKDKDGKPCIQIKTVLDLEAEKGLPYGNIFQENLKFPFAEKEEEIGTFGVETLWPNIFLSGASAKRGGGVSGIAGFHAASKVIAIQ